MAISLNVNVYMKKKTIYGGIVCIEWEQETILFMNVCQFSCSQKNVNVKM